MKNIVQSKSSKLKIFAAFALFIVSKNPKRIVLFVDTINQEKRC
ncbi:MAG: hypothetical protein H6Q66_2518 [Firmicutes bacterium]|nr:hypothetical protein [Bacillota bacterium]